MKKHRDREGIFPPFLGFDLWLLTLLYYLVLLLPLKGKERNLEGGGTEPEPEQNRKRAETLRKRERERGETNKRSVTKLVSVFTAFNFTSHPSSQHMYYYMYTYIHTYISFP